jgi:hypothetical protein
VREQSFDEVVVTLCIQIGAAIFDDDQAIVFIARMKEGGQDNPASRYPEQDEGLNFSCPQNHSLVCTGKGADPVLGNDNVIGLRSHGRVSCAGRSKKELLMLDRPLHGAEERITQTDLR